jgi:acetyltransferase-like isoleucine patch superfamily enzyme
MRNYFFVFLNELLSDLGEVLAICPGRLGNFLRKSFHKKFVRGDATSVDWEMPTFIKGHKNITIGSAVGFSRGCSLQAEAGRIVIGSNTKFNNNVIINANFSSVEIGKIV